MIIKKLKQLPSILSASSLSPLPMAIDAFGAPPDATSAAKAETTSIIGRQTPTPVRARLPSPGICPRYILSTTLYSMLIICATTVGTASLNRSGPIGAVPSSLLFLFIIGSP